MENPPRRTVVIKLDVSSDAAESLHQTKQQFLYCANQTSDWAWRHDDYCVTSKNTAEKALYADLKDETDLTANLVQKGIRRAIEAVTHGVERLKNGEPTSQPHFQSWSVVYDKRSATFNADHATLSTANGRVTAEYVVPPESKRGKHHSAVTTITTSGRPHTLRYSTTNWPMSSISTSPRSALVPPTANGKKPLTKMMVPRTEWFSAST